MDLPTEIITINLPPISHLALDNQAIPLSCSSYSTDKPDQDIAARRRRHYRLDPSCNEFRPDRSRVRKTKWDLKIRSGLPGLPRVEEGDPSDLRAVDGGVVDILWRQWSRRDRARRWDRLEINTGSGTVVKGYRIQRNGITTIILYEAPDTASFISRLPDDVPLGALTFPGTHESCALYGFPISQCQQRTTPISQQLLDGMRFLDVRLKVVDGQLMMYHGITSQRSSLHFLLDTLSSFLASHPGEAVILSLKDEVRNEVFSKLLYREMMDERYRQMWFLEDRVPRLGEVRGKVVLMCRFPIDQDDKNWNEGSGIHPSGWGNSRREGFEWDCGGTLGRIQDWYAVPTFLQIPDKFETATDFLLPTIPTDHTVIQQPCASTHTSTPDTVTQTALTHPPTTEKSTTFAGPAPHKAVQLTSPPPLTLSFISASSFPLALPGIMAKGFGFPAWGLGVEGLNSRMLGWLLSLVADGRRVRGGIIMDFYRLVGNGGGEKVESGISEILVMMNHFDD